MGGVRTPSAGTPVTVAFALVLLLQSQVSSGNVLATPAPSATLDPNYAVHPSAADLAQGRRLFDVHCTSCHGTNLQGTAQGPPLIDVDAVNVDFQLRTGRMPAAIPFEQEYQKPPIFTQRQVQTVVDYVMSRSQGRKALPAVSPFGDPKRGREVYEENCEQCHAATGHGDAVGYQDVAPELMNASPEQIAEAVRMGPDVMPKFGPAIIDDRQLDDVIAYVRFLQRGTDNPGGLALANWGPVSEGFVAWTVGLGLLVLLVRRIGTTD